eukprot:1574089-Prymnesium_polylepis.1
MSRSSRRASNPNLRGNCRSIPVSSRRARTALRASSREPGKRQTIGRGKRKLRNIRRWNRPN